MRITPKGQQVSCHPLNRKFIKYCTSDPKARGIMEAEIAFWLLGFLPLKKVNVISVMKLAREAAQRCRLGDCTIEVFKTSGDVLLGIWRILLLPTKGRPIELTVRIPKSKPVNDILEEMEWGIRKKMT